ncbi:hypothetical protein [Rhodanobacter sp. C03]|uniref:hypothetical protein n=1 Tax=Rhodanobacter sp. C03 TaxID=1945858 RepID=UPI0011159914|nr:hypothetical protein [Rhodanobacter sp. C03]
MDNNAKIGTQLFESLSFEDRIIFNKLVALYTDQREARDSVNNARTGALVCISFGIAIISLGIRVYLDKAIGYSIFLIAIGLFLCIVGYGLWKSKDNVELRSDLLDMFNDRGIYETPLLLLAFGGFVGSYLGILWSVLFRQ